jgi:hypothetical protein
MRTNTQTLPVGAWGNEPELKVVARNGDKQDRPAPKVFTPPGRHRRVRREMEVLGWDARVVRLISLTRGNA